MGPAVVQRLARLSASRLVMSLFPLQVGFEKWTRVQDRNQGLTPWKGLGGVKATRLILTILSTTGEVAAGLGRP